MHFKMISCEAVPCLKDTICSLFLSMKLVSEKYAEFVILCSRRFVIFEKEELLCKK